MSKAGKPVLLVGSVPCQTADETFRTVAPVLGDLAIGLSDGEIDARRYWVMYIALNTWGKHPDLEVIRPVLEYAPRGLGLPEWLPAGYHALPWWAPKAGVTKLSPIGTLGYPAEAAASYRTFRRLRDQGLVPRGARFQQCLPFPEDGARLFTNSARSMSMMVEAYIDVMKRDVARLCEQIPHEDLVLQWDINWETIGIEHGDHLPDMPPMQFKPDGQPLQRFARYVGELNASIPAPVRVGLHLCYGDFHHKHFLDPADLAASVTMANKAAEVSPRAIDFVHMAVPRHRSDDKYFAPLRDLRIGDATVYAGLVHYTDGVAGSLKRLAAFKRHFSGPTGVATECGLGHRPKDQDLATLLKIHRDIAAQI
ncbi:MAG: hypothetical protein ACREB3_04560 [Burkholderiales bacterium]